MSPSTYIYIYIYIHIYHMILWFSVFFVWWQERKYRTSHYPSNDEETKSNCILNSFSSQLTNSLHQHSPPLYHRHTLGAIDNTIYFQVTILNANHFQLYGWLVVGFYGISNSGYLTPNPFLCKQFYFKQFSLAWVYSLIVKNISISNYTVFSNSSNSNNSV